MDNNSSSSSSFVLCCCSSLNNNSKNMKRRCLSSSFPFVVKARPSRAGPRRDAAQHGLTRRHDIRDTLIKNGNPAVCSLMLLLAHFHLLLTKQPDALKHFVFFLFFFDLVSDRERRYFHAHDQPCCCFTVQTHTHHSTSV